MAAVIILSNISKYYNPYLHLQHLMFELPLQIYDLIGAGFGPANLAIAAALTDKWSDSKVTPPYSPYNSLANTHHKSVEENMIRNPLFIETHPTFLWHPGMLLPGSLMQIRHEPASSHLLSVTYIMSTVQKLSQGPGNSSKANVSALLPRISPLSESPCRVH